MIRKASVVYNLSASTCARDNQLFAFLVAHEIAKRMVVGLPLSRTPFRNTFSDQGSSECELLYLFASTFSLPGAPATRRRTSSTIAASHPFELTTLSHHQCLGILLGH